MKSWIWAVVALAAFFFGGWLLGRHFAQPEVVETTRIDTVYFERPQPIASSNIEVEVNVPKFIFAPADTVDRLVIVGDSVKMTITERTLEYRDSTYYARVVGPVVGQLGPRLDYLETYNKTVERVQLVREPYAWEFGPAAGAWMGRHDAGVWAGGYVRRTFGRFSVSVAAGYDARNTGAFGQIQAGVALWRR